jgi:heme exporter protein D
LVSAPLLNHRALLKEVNRDIQRQQDRELALKATVPTDNHKESD